MLVFAIRLLEGIFVLGAAGCVFVLLLTAVDDLGVLFGRSERREETPSPKVEHGALELPQGFSRG
jgi:hypothetical protein